MGCLSVDIARLGASPIVNITNLGGLALSVKRVGEPLRLAVSDILKGLHLNITCGIVCSISELHYLKVSPSDVQWITPDYGVVYSVESDTNWIIVTS